MLPEQILVDPMRIRGGLKRPLLEPGSAMSVRNATRHKFIDLGAAWTLPY
jgi:hypothetical protein